MKSLKRRDYRGNVREVEITDDPDNYRGQGRYVAAIRSPRHWEARWPTSRQSIGGCGQGHTPEEAADAAIRDLKERKGGEA